MSGGKRIHDRNKERPSGLVTDERFARLHTDPRFRRKAKADVRLGIDKRFERMFSDKTFQSSSGLVDKRGRVKSSSPAEELKRYYQLEDDSPEGEEETIELKQGEGKGNKVTVSLAKSSSSRQAQARKGGVVPRVRSIQVTAEELEQPVSEEDDTEEASKADNGESASELSSSSSDDSDSDAGDLEEAEAEAEEVATTEKETSRIALVNLDWENLTAADIYAMLQSFVPKSGRLQSVSVYPSEFGLARMAEEQQLGPRAAFGGGGGAGAASDEDDDEEDKEVVMERLRKYEKERLRYFFAVAVFDSPSAADAVYAACDGLEFEKSSNVLDLRFIPDGMAWEAKPRDTATAMPAQYAAPDFFTRALQHSNVRLTWDDDEPRRTKALHRKLDPDELQELDFKDYLASGSEDEEAGSLLEEGDEGAEVSAGEEEEGEGEGDQAADAQKGKPSAAPSKKQKQAEKYRLLLLEAGAGGDEGEGGAKAGGLWKSQRGAEAAELEVTFHSGLDGLGERLKQKLADKEAQAQETVWEAHLRKKREKKKAKKSAAEGEAGAEAGAGSSDDGLYEDRQNEDEFFRHEDDPFADPFFKSGGDDAETAGDTGDANKGKGRGGSAKMKAAEAERERRRQEMGREREEEARQRAELELLMMDERGGTAAKGFNLKGKAKKPSKKERRRGKAAAEGAGEGAAPAADGGGGGGGDFADPRFTALFTSPDFAVDPTDPRFSKVAGHQRFLEEKQRRRQQQQQQPSRRTQEDANGKQQQGVHGNGSTQAKGAQAKSELNMLVRSLKRKVASQGAPLSGPKALRAL